MPAIELSSTETTPASVPSPYAPWPNGRTSRACSIPGTRTLCTYTYDPVTFAGMSSRGIREVPTRRYWSIGLAGAWPADESRSRQRDREHPSAEQLGVRDRAAAARDGPAAGRERGHRHPERLRAELEEYLPRGGAGSPEPAAGGGDRAAAEGAAGVGADARVVADEAERRRVGVELLGDEQREAGRRALPELHPPAGHRDGAVGVEGEIRVGLRRVGIGGRGVPCPGTADRERDEQRAAALHHRTPRELAGDHQATTRK